MLFRAIALSIALLIGIGTIVPLATDIAEAGPKRAKKYKKHKKYRKYSKRWWRQHRAKLRRQRALQARRRALRLRRLRLAKARRSNNKEVRPRVAAVTKSKSDQDSGSSLLPSGEAAPSGWRKSGASGSEIMFSVDDGRGTAAISVVGPAVGETVDTGRQRAVGGVSTSALRREVINRMIRENGWVVNDYQKEVGGKSVYVVVAQSQATGGRVQSRMFYFTESDGRIYSVSTNSSTDSAERIAEESEKVIYSLRPRSVQQAAVKH